MTLLVDMNLSPRWIDRLVSEGFEAVHWSSIGPANAPDRVIMAHAKLNGQIVLMHDLDFSAILAATGGTKPSVVQLRAEDLSPDVIGSAVVTALRQMQSELEQGALLTVDAQRSRVRLLPLR